MGPDGPGPPARDALCISFDDVEHGLLEAKTAAAKHATKLADSIAAGRSHAAAVYRDVGA